MTDLQYAANCALWLLTQDQLKPIMESSWGDPEVIKNMLIKAGCVPSCERKFDMPKERLASILNTMVIPSCRKTDSRLEVWDV